MTVNSADNFTTCVAWVFSWRMEMRVKPLGLFTWAKSTWQDWLFLGLSGTTDMEWSENNSGCITLGKLSLPLYPLVVLLFFAVLCTKTSEGSFKRQATIFLTSGFTAISHCTCWFRSWLNMTFFMMVCQMTLLYIIWSQVLRIILSWEAKHSMIHHKSTSTAPSSFPTASSARRCTLSFAIALGTRRHSGQRSTCPGPHPPVGCCWPRGLRKARRYLKRIRWNAGAAAEIRRLNWEYSVQITKI